jgi:enediyne biosynthesis thioesterase
MRFYEYHHVVGFEETNLVGNVYFVNHIRWQGRCRETFLRDNAPGVLVEIEQGLALVTVRVVCDYFEELRALDEITVRMRLVAQSQNRLTMGFEYVRAREGREKLVARGEQQVACMRREADRMVPIPIPPELREALAPFAST